MLENSTPLAREGLAEKSLKRPKRWLALDTSTPDVVMALVENEQVMFEQVFWSGTGHSEQILGQIDAALSLVSWRVEDLEAMVVGQGPGSFTGLRVGVATAQGLAWALGIPLFGVSSLDAWAWSAPMAATSWVVACVDARKDQVYAGFYRIEEGEIEIGQSEPSEGRGMVNSQEATDPKRCVAVSARCVAVSSPLLVSPWLLHEAIKRMPSALLVGTGVSVMGRVWREQGAVSARWPAVPVKLRGSALVALAQQDQAKGRLSEASWSVLPVYVRAADAELQVTRQEDEVWFAEEVGFLREVLFPSVSSASSAR